MAGTYSVLIMIITMTLVNNGNIATVKAQIICQKAQTFKSLIILSPRCPFKVVETGRIKRIVQGKCIP